MIRRVTLPAIALAMVMSAASVFAADVDGRWTGQLETPMGTVPITFVFKADGAMLTSAMIGMDGGQIPISDGKVDGDKISYPVKLDFGGMPFEIAYTGVVSASEITLHGTAFDMPFEFVVTKEQ